MTLEQSTNEFYNALGGTDIQPIVNLLVSNEVRYCVSQLIHEISHRGELCLEFEDEICALWSPVITDDHRREYAEDNGLLWDEDKEEYIDEDGDIFDMEEIDLSELEQYAGEVYEHWLVSDWLADKLIEHNERVVKDFMGLTIWARTCTGQSISMDGVIHDIVKELHDKEGR
jgi:hypothetical protein